MFSTELSAQQLKIGSEPLLKKVCQAPVAASLLLAVRCF
jgi:hypothetical protein